jgi:gamma-glutamyl hercynylcysteine S-oxide synthase
MATMERGLVAFLVSENWQPYYTTEMRGLFASYFPPDHDAVWTLVNRSKTLLNGELLRVKEAPAGAKFYDVYHGTELIPRWMAGCSSLIRD